MACSGITSRFICYICVFFFHFCGLYGKTYFPTNPDNRESTVLKLIPVNRTVWKLVYASNNPPLETMRCHRMRNKSQTSLTVTALGFHQTHSSFWTLTLILLIFSFSSTLLENELNSRIVEGWRGEISSTPVHHTWRAPRDRALPRQQALCFSPRKQRVVPLLFLDLKSLQQWSSRNLFFIKKV
jgi:hypothetical protein